MNLKRWKNIIFFLFQYGNSFHTNDFPTSVQYLDTHLFPIFKHLWTLTFSLSLCLLPTGTFQSLRKASSSLLLQNLKMVWWHSDSSSARRMDIPHSSHCGGCCPQPSWWHCLMPATVQRFQAFQTRAGCVRV